MSVEGGEAQAPSAGRRPTPAHGDGAAVAAALQAAFAWVAGPPARPSPTAAPDAASALPAAEDRALVTVPGTLAPQAAPTPGALGAPRAAPVAALTGASRATEPRTIHIGAIEVEIVPPSRAPEPPAAARAAAGPPPPLARGFASTLGLRQG